MSEIASATAASACSSRNPAKRPICRYFMQGNCRFGDDCTFSHDIGNQSDLEAKKSIPCYFFQQGNCRYGDYCHFSHDEVDNEKESWIGADDTDHSNLCSICFENIVSSGKRFGLLPDCEHTFCLDCLRTWRKQTKHEICDTTSKSPDPLKCPVCRAKIAFIIPSKDFLKGEAKERVITLYKTKVGKIPCKNFSGVVGSCNFGKDCFYAHLGPNGEDLKTVDYARKQSSRRRRRDDDAFDLQLIDRLMGRELMSIFSGRDYAMDDQFLPVGQNTYYDSDDSSDIDYPY